MRIEILSDAEEDLVADAKFYERQGSGLGDAEHACLRHSGRVGRTAAAKQLDSDVIYLAVAASVRHEFTDYNLLLLRGIDKSAARSRLRDKVHKKLREWGADSE